MKRFHIFLVILLAMGGMMTSCTRYVKNASHPGLNDGEYDSSFPIGSDNEVLEQIVESVRLLNASAQYDRFDFSREEAIRLSDITTTFIKENRDKRVIMQDYAVGTATLIYADKKRIAVLTCAHVVDFPDTVVTYYATEEGASDSVIQKIAIKTRQRIHLSDIRQGEDVKILALDRNLDVAILGKELLFRPASPMPILPCTLGKARELSWGNFVYVIGFPAGKKMITRGIISNPNRGSQHGFLVDALFNRGFSGGIVLAVRDGIPNFELVGIVNSVAADTYVRLAPDPGYDKSLVDTYIPYTGKLYLRSEKKINYGISFGISIEAILDFMKRNAIALKNAGYRMDRFFQQQ